MDPPEGKYISLQMRVPAQTLGLWISCPHEPDRRLKPHPPISRKHNPSLPPNHGAIHLDILRAAGSTGVTSEIKTVLTITIALVTSIRGIAVTPSPVGTH